MKVLITAGPTEEHIDVIRFITNKSSGKMGVELAREAIKRKHKVVLICNPLRVNVPKGIKVRSIRTSDDIIKVTLEELKSGYDIFISTAAIADFKPKKFFKSKLSSSRKFILELSPTKKLTMLVKKRFPKIFMVAFKAEYGVDEKTLCQRSRRKLRDENLDIIVANDIKKNFFGSNETEISIIDKNGFIKRIPKCKKISAAREIWNYIETNFC